MDSVLYYRGYGCRVLWSFLYCGRLEFHDLPLGVYFIHLSGMLHNRHTGKLSLIDILSAFVYKIGNTIVIYILIGDADILELSASASSDKGTFTTLTVLYLIKKLQICEFLLL